ncbi:MAG TPA: terpene cyclase/mutase family protein [Candidatus Moranbacteria bacterium]|nr:terpene cyclase/mutase family protein [Candidatus Moranbacteria bacterium]HRZ33572.1 terpene cyclase/mutase family protein [Candidatus Moranbacteria bacterium]
MQINRKSKIIFCWALFFIIVFLVVFKDQMILKTHAYFSIRKSLSYIFSQQSENGEFKTYACKNENMDECILDSTSYNVSMVINSIQNIKIKKSKKNIILKKGANFLLKSQEKNGAWHYWTSKVLKGFIIPPDVDDTVNASYALLKNNIKFIDNKDLIEKNRDERGLFYTYIREKHTGFDPDIDCVVNISALLYLQSNDPRICSYINESIRSENKCSPYYYPDRLGMYYFLSRAYTNGITCLGDEKNIIISSILKKQNKDGSFGNDLQNGLAINALLDMGYSGPEIKKGISLIIKNQKEDGSWENESFWMGMQPYQHNGSPVLTTAINSEALNKYLFKL